MNHQSILSPNRTKQLLLSNSNQNLNSNYIISESNSVKSNNNEITNDTSITNTYSHKINGNTNSKSIPVAGRRSIPNTIQTQFHPPNQLDSTFNSNQSHNPGNINDKDDYKSSDLTSSKSNEKEKNSQSKYEQTINSLRNDLLIQKKHSVTLQRNCQLLTQLVRILRKTLSETISKLKNQQKFNSTIITDTNEKTEMNLQIETLQNDNSKLTSQISNFQSKILSLESQLSKSQTSLSEMSSSRQELLRDVNRLNLLVRQQNSQSNPIKTKNVNNENGSDILTNQTLSKQLNETQQLLNENRNEIQQLETEVKTHRITIAHLKNEISKLEKQLTVSNNSNERQRCLIETLKQEKNDLAEMNSDLSEDLSIRASQLTNVTNELSENKNQLNKLNEKTLRLQKETNSLKKKFEKEWSQRVDLEHQLQNIKAESSTQRVISNETPQDFDTSAQSQKDKTQPFSNSTNQKNDNSIKADFESLLTQYSVSLQTISKLQHDIKNLTSECKTLKLTNQTLINDIESSENKSNDLSSQLKNVQEKLSETAAKLSRQTESHLSEIKQLENRLNDTSFKNDAEIQISSLQSELAHLKTTSATNDKTTSELQYQLNTSQSRVKQLTNEILSLKNQLLKSKQSTADVTAELSRLKQSQSNIDPQLLSTIQSELLSTVSKLILSEEASESSFTCYNCLSFYKSPITVTSCGH